MNSLPIHPQNLYEKLLTNPPYSWFPSSEFVLEEMLKYAQVTPGIVALDPTGGEGAVARKLQSAGAVVDVIEINPLLQQILFQQGFNLVGSDFMKTEPQRLYRVLVANPPFSFSPLERGVDLTIIRRAFDLFLAPGGRLVSVVSDSHKHSQCSKARAFRGWLNQIDAQLIELPLEAFWGTLRPVTVESWLVIAKK
ncbi:class I SAM-dependent methyltransferase [Microcoleus sp. herbarium8]|uniref:class I SAM-dependent methyltransferase n=1 Tax=Microcoleus sp. herbarium8 TaxID=3055436 RepID=UPI002FD5701E